MKETKQPNKIPVFIGITGHRMFRNSKTDNMQLRAAVKAAITEIMRGFKNTEFILLTALAAGTDQLTAEVAAEMGMPYAVVLPMESEKYLYRATKNGADFTDEERENARRLMEDKTHCKFTYVIPYEQEKGVTKDNVCDYSDTQYADIQFNETAKFISDNCFLLLALWDGKLASEAAAGAGASVRDALHGTPYHSDFCSGITVPETRPVYHIYTPRPNDPPKAYDFKLRRLFPEPILETGDSWFTVHPSFEQGGDAGMRKLFTSPLDKKSKSRLRAVMSRIRAIDRFNKDIYNDSKCPTASESTDKSTSVNHRAKFCYNYYYESDALAQWYQKRRNRWGKIIVYLAGLSYILLSVFTDLLYNPILLAGYIGMILVTYLVWRVVEKNAYHRYFVDYRTLAEGLRVQFHWYQANVTHGESVAQAQDFYLRRQKGKVDWIRFAIRNINLLALAKYEEQPASLEQIINTSEQWLGKMDIKVNGEWIPAKNDEGQMAYFVMKSKKLMHFSKSLETWAHVCIYLSLLLALILLVSIIFVQGAFGDNKIADYLMFAIGVLPIIAMIIKEITGFMGYEKDADRYKWYHIIFKRAIIEINELIRKIPDEALRTNRIREKLFEIGKEALIENAGWVELNTERAPKVPSN